MTSPTSEAERPRLWLDTGRLHFLNTSWPTEVHAWSCQSLEKEPQRVAYISVQEHERILAAHAERVRGLVEAAREMAAGLTMRKWSESTKNTFLDALAAYDREGK